MGIEQALRAIAFPSNMTTENNKTILAEHTVTLGRSALAGERGLFYDGLVYATSLILWHLEKFTDLSSAADYVREVLDSGRAVTRL